MKKSQILLIIVSFISFLCGQTDSIQTAEIMLKNGSNYKGVITQQNEKELVIKTNYGELTIPIKDLLFIDYGVFNIIQAYLDIEEDSLSDEMDFETWDAPPPPPEGPRVKFIPYDDPPKPLTPISPKYPEIAQEAGIEGTVIIQVFVDVKGRVQETIVLKGIPNSGLDEAAIKAIRSTKFRPAKQRRKPVGVWISIPVNFKLN